MPNQHHASRDTPEADAEGDAAVTPADPPQALPRPVVIVALLVLLALLGYGVVTEGDYRVIIALALAVLILLGADVGAVMRSWRGGDQTPGTTPPEPGIDLEKKP